MATLEETLQAERRAHSDLILVLGHELRTPISVINGFSRLLLDGSEGALSEQQLHFVNETLKACKRLDHFVGDLLEASPGSSRLLTVSPELGDLDETIRSTLEALSPLISDREIQVELDLEPTIPELVFDSLRIRQVLNNILTNAIRYGRSGGAIRVGRFQDESHRGLTVQVYVDDDGPGISPADRLRVFEPYVRGAAQSECAGMGIGLAICKRIIASHSGSIRVEDGPRGGARFVFSLPVTPSATRE